MGEIAEMIIDGTVCQVCGEFIDGESPGYPRGCSQSCSGEIDIDSDDDFSFESEMKVIETVLKEYKKIVWKTNCKCVQGNHHPTCKAGKKRDLAKAALVKYKEFMAN